MLAPLTRVKLIGLDPEAARQALLNALKDRLKPDLEPDFPGSPLPQVERTTPSTVAFPGLPHNLPRSGTVKFVGRETELANLHTQLHQCDRLAITALRGMGGIGKTELALQYAQAHRDYYTGGICWLQAKEQDIGTEILNFALVHLGLTPPDGLAPDAPGGLHLAKLAPPRRGAPPCAQCNVSAHTRFPRRPTRPDIGAKSPRPCIGRTTVRPMQGLGLVVIDDVSGTDDIAAYAAIKPYLPPQETRKRVLLTTRLQLGASIQTVQIDVLSEAASLELLRSLTGGDRISQETDTAKALCQWLGYLPLGLELVGRFLARKSGWTLSKMQQRLNDNRLAAKALCQVHPAMTAEHESIAAAFELSWQDLEPEAQELAYRLGLFALAPIAWQWMESWYEGTDADDLEDWRDDGLVNRSLLNLDGDSTTVQLHQIIREFFRAKLELWAGGGGAEAGLWPGDGADGPAGAPNPHPRPNFGGDGGDTPPGRGRDHLATVVRG